MKPSTARLSHIALGFAVAISAALFCIADAGQLEAPGPPSPTMKTLDEIAPCKLIRQADIPFTITMPGSYCLAEDVSSAAEYAIRIQSEGVSLDLGGHTVIGGGTPIEGGSNVSIRRGTVHGLGLWGLRLGSNARVSDVRADAFEESAIVVGGGSIVDLCVASGGRTPLSVGPGSMVSRTSANGGSGGIEGGDGVTVVGCTAGGAGLAGIQVGANSFVTNNVATDGIATGRGSVVQSNRIFLDHNTVFLGSGSLFLDNTVQCDFGHGPVIARENSIVRGNNIVGCAPGISVLGARNRIESNNLDGRGAEWGIQVESPGNLIIKNSVANNITNYDIVPGNDVGPIGTAATSTSAWANFSY